MNNLNQGASIEAAPCPFCGSEKLDIAIGMVERPSDYIMCNDETGCGAMISREDTKDGNLLAAWNRRTPAATTGDGELPPLPEPKIAGTPKNLRDVIPNSIPDLFSEQQMRDYARAAIAADRAQRQAVLNEQATTLLAQRKKIQKHDAEIADLRAQLAVKGQGDTMQRVRDLLEGAAAWSPGDEAKQKIHAALDLLDTLAAPASAQPADLPVEDVAVLRKWAAQVERLAPGFTDERSLLCQQAAVLLYRISYRPAGAQPDQRESAVVPACRNQGGICACRSGGSFGGCAMERAASPAAQPAKDDVDKS